MSAKRPSTCGADRLALDRRRPSRSTPSAETQKWFDQNQTSRSTKPISAAIAASSRALASLRKSCCGAMPTVGRGRGRRVFVLRHSWAARASRAGGAAHLAAAPDGTRPPARRRAAAHQTRRAAMRPAPARSSSAISAPRGSDAIAAIEPARGPRSETVQRHRSLCLAIQCHLSPSDVSRPIEPIAPMRVDAPLSCRD